MSFSPDNPRERAAAQRRAKEAKEAAEKAKEQKESAEETKPEPADDGGGTGDGVSTSPGPTERADLRDGERVDTGDGGTDGDSGGFDSSPIGGNTSPDSPQERQDAQDAAADTERVAGGEDARSGTSVVVTEDGGDIRNAITPDQFEQFQQQTEREIGTDDLVMEDGDVRLTESAREQEGQALAELGQETREQAAESTTAVDQRMERERREAVDEAAGDLEAQLEAQVGDDLTRGEDFRVRDAEGGGITAVLTESYRREQLRGRVEANLEDQAGRDLQAGEDFDVAFDATDQPARPTAEQFESFEGQEADGATADVTLSQDLQQELSDRGVQTESGEITAGQRASGPSSGPESDGDVFSGVVAGIEGGLSDVAQVASGDEDTSVEFQGEGSVVNESRENAPESGERFGGEGAVESELRDLSQQFQETVVDPAASAAGEFAGSGAGAVGSAAADPVGTAIDFSQGYLDVVGETAATAREEGGEEAAAEFLDTDAGEFVTPPQDAQTRQARGRGSAEGALGITNVAGLGVTAIEAGEVVVAGGEAVAAGEGGEFAGEAAGAGAVMAADAVRFAQANPDRFFGQVLGSAAASGGILGGAQRLGGPRTARGAAYAIQPGEELALAAARRGIPGGQRVAGAISDVDVQSEARRLASDDRGTLQLGGRRGRGDSDAESDTPTIDEDLQDALARFERSDRTRRAEERARERVRESQEEQARQEQRQRGPPDRVSGQQEGGDFVARQQAGGDFVASDQPSTFGMGPTATQQRVFRGARRQSAEDPDLSPSERQLVDDIEADTPAGDLRRLRTLEEELPETDARIEASQRRDVLDGDQSPIGGTATLAGLLRGTEVRTQAAEAQAVGEETATRPAIDVSAAQRPDITQGIETDSGVRGEPDTRFEIDTGLRTEPRSETEQRQEIGTRQDQRQETREETRQEPRQEFRQEARQEQRRETRRETRFETRREVDTRGEPRDSGDDDDDEDGFGRGLGVVLTEFADPLSGGVPSADQIDQDIPGLFER